MSDDLAAALVAGLLGGGVTGAVVGGITSLVVQRRAIDNERSSRFAETRRDRYADLIAVADRAILRADRSARLPTLVAGGTVEPESAVHLASIERDSLREDPNLTDISSLVAQIQLLGPSSAGDAAETLAGSLHDLSGIATPLIAMNVGLGDPGVVDFAKGYGAEVDLQVPICRRDRNLFLEAAQRDIGLDDRQSTSGRKA